MVYQYDIEFINDNGRGHSGRDFGLILEEYLIIPSAQTDIEQIYIPGRDGELVRKGNRRNVTITGTLTSLIKPKDQLEERDLYRNIRSWLTGYGWLKIDDNQEARYRVLHAEIKDPKRETPLYGKIGVSFLCEPYEYAESGFITYENLTYNGYDMCKPVYRVSGGPGSITVNGKEITINSAVGLTIDTARQLVYKTSNTELINNGITGDYEDLWLDNGPIIVTPSSGITVSIEPRWGWNL